MTEAMDSIRAFVDSPTNERHLANCHFVGVNSIVLQRRPSNTLLRVYIVRPGEMPSALLHPSSPFLHHQHAYDFRSTTLHGTVVNHVFDRGNGKRHTFCRYRFRSGLECAGALGIEEAGAEPLRERRVDTIVPGADYYQCHDAIHRVEFLPDRATGWFGCLIDETATHQRPEYAWSRYLLDDIPDRDALYRPLKFGEAKALVRGLMAAMGESQS